MFGRTTTLALIGVETARVTVEVDIDPGLPTFQIVGLPDTAVQEARARVRSAMSNSEFDFPQRRVTVNLAPADLRKVGPGFDLALAAAILVGSGQLEPAGIEEYALCGELGLDGRLRSVRGTVALADGVRKHRLRGVIVPAQNAAEAQLIPELEVIALNNLRELLSLDEIRAACGAKATAHRRRQPRPRDDSQERPDLNEVSGQLHAKRALEIAAAGGHNLLFVGPPGMGKTMLARRLPGILPPLSAEEALEVTKVHSIASELPECGLIDERPFRAPHHTISVAGLVGGGNAVLRPGEITLAHGGVLFLDELAEFARGALEALRQPLEAGAISLHRAAGWIRFPARFALVGATNPCPCGFYGDPLRECICTPARLYNYRSRLSGPLIDRIDMVVPVVRQELPAGEQGRKAESSAQVRVRVTAARARQAKRFGSTGTHANAALRPRDMARACRMEPAAQAQLRAAATELRLSGRGHDRTLKVARTIADLARRERITAADIGEALSYRAGDRQLAAA